MRCVCAGLVKSVLMLTCAWGAGGGHKAGSILGTGIRSSDRMFQCFITDYKLMV